MNEVTLNSCIKQERELIIIDELPPRNFGLDYESSSIFTSRHLVIRLKRCDELIEKLKSGKVDASTKKQRKTSKTREEKCPHCVKSFVSIHTSREYICGIHLGEFKCKDCKMIFSTKEMMSKHLLDKNKCIVSSGKGPKECIIDNHNHAEKFDRIIVGNNSKECLRCDHCSEIFNIQSKKRLMQLLLDNHFPCKSDLEFPVGRNNFKSVNLLKKHVELNHSSSFTCNPCPKTYKRKSQLKDHIKIFHEKKFKCEKCQKCFANQASLYRHFNKKNCGKDRRKAVTKNEDLLKFFMKSTFEHILKTM